MCCILTYYNGQRVSICKYLLTKRDSTGCFPTLFNDSLMAKDACYYTTGHDCIAAGSTYDNWALCLTKIVSGAINTVFPRFERKISLHTCRQNNPGNFMCMGGTDAADIIMSAGESQHKWTC